MQDAKDTFYEVLRDGVAAADGSLTVVVRGVLRPAVVVDENETVTAAERRDCFRLRWTERAADEKGAAALETARCEIRYATAGSAGAGLDRGRVLAGLDAVLMRVLNAAPQSAVKKDFSALRGGGAAVTLGSRVWWSDVAFGPLAEDAGELRRTASVDVWSYREAGEA